MIRLARLWRRLHADQRGLSAVEFALLAPVLILFYFGMAEFCQGFMAQKRAGHATSMVADLVSQQEKITKSQIDDIGAVGGLIMTPFSAAPLKVRVASVTRQTNGTYKVDWIYGPSLEAAGVAARKKGDLISIPNGMLTGTDSLVMSETAYDYDSPVDYLMPAITRFRHVYYLRPRTVDKTLCTDC